MVILLMIFPVPVTTGENIILMGNEKQMLLA